MNNKEIKKGRKPGDTMKIGAIISIVFGAIVMVAGLIGNIIFLAMGVWTKDITNQFINQSGFDFNFHIGGFMYGFAILGVVLSLVNIPNIIANTMLLKGKLNNTIVPGILALLGLGIGLVGIACAVLIMTGKFEDEIDNSQNQDFVSRNFKTPNGNGWSETNSKDTWKQATNHSTLNNSSQTDNNQIKEMQEKINELEQKLNQNKEINK